jgi:hypothetical protein
MKISSTSLVKAAPDQVFANLDDEAVILNLKDGVYYGLNSVGAHIWNLLQERRTVGEIRNLILAEYKVLPVRCERDLIQLLQDLAAKGLIVVGDGETT